MEEVIIFGCGGHAKVVIDIIEKSNKYKIAALIGVDNEIGGSTFDYPIISEEKIRELNINKAIIAIGDNKIRKKISEIHKSFDYIVVIHPSAQIGRDVNLGAGTVLMANAVINPDVTVGIHSIVNTSASIDHECLIGDYVHICPSVTLGGNVQVGNGSKIGLGTNIIHQVCVGSSVSVGAGSLILKDISDNLTIYGVPAKEVNSL